MRQLVPALRLRVSGPSPRRTGSGPTISSPRKLDDFFERFPEDPAMRWKRETPIPGRRWRISAVLRARRGPRVQFVDPDALDRMQLDLKGAVPASFLQPGATRPGRQLSRRGGGCLRTLQKSRIPILNYGTICGYAGCGDTCGFPPTSWLNNRAEGSAIENKLHQRDRVLNKAVNS